MAKTAFNIIILFCISILSFLSCKKEKNSPPVVQIISPVENSAFNAIDTLRLKMKVSDDKSVISFYITICDDNGNSVSPPETWQVNKGSTDINVVYHINNIHLESGKYYLEVVVNDNSDFTKAFAGINIAAIPKKLLGRYLFSYKGDGTTRVFTIDSANSPVYKFTFEDILQKATSNSYFQQLILTGKNHGIAEAYTTSGLLYWRADNLNNSSFQYEGTSVAIDKYIYICYSAGFIKGFDDDGRVIRNIDIGDINYSPYKFAETDGMVLCASKPHTPARKKLSASNLATGIHLYDYTTDIDVVEIFPYDDTRAIIWANENGLAHAYTFDMVYQSLDEINGIPQSKLNAVKYIYSDYFIASIGNNLYLFNKSNNSTIPFRSNISCNGLEYEELSGLVYVMDKSSITLLRFADGLNAGTVQHSDSITGISFLYNK